jgi:hypothetical protein
VRYLDYAEDQAQRRRPMTMADWAAKLDSFLRFNERNVLEHAGTVSHELAVAHASTELDRFDAERRRIEATEPTPDSDHIVAGVKALEGTRKQDQLSKSKGGRRP